MPSADKHPMDGGPAYPGMAREVHLPADDNRPFQVVQQPMNGMSIRDVATLQILSDLVTARCTAEYKDGYENAIIQHNIRHEWIVEAMDVVDAWLEVRGQV